MDVADKLLAGFGVVTGGGTLVFGWLAWHKSELREAREELRQAHRDKLALQREITRLLHVAYPDPRPHERPEL